MEIAMWRYGMCGRSGQRINGRTSRLLVVCFPEKAGSQMQGRTHVNIYTITLVVFPYRAASIATGIPRRTV